MYASVAMVTTFPYQQVIQLTKYEVCTPLNAKVMKVSFSKTGRPKNMPRRLPGFVPSHSDEIAPLMPISNSAESKFFTP